MNNCNTSPLFIPTTVNALIRNIDAVDVAATNISCTNLTVNGEPISTVISNIGETSANKTVFTGNLTSDTMNATSITADTGTFTTEIISPLASLSTVTSLIQNTSTLNATTVAATNIGGTLTTATQNNVTKIGTQTSLAVAGNISQTTGTTSLQATTLASLSTTGLTSGTTVRFSSPTAITWGLSAATQSIPNNTETKLVWGVYKFASGLASTSYSHVGGNIQNGSGGTRSLLVTYSVTWAANSTNSRNAYITTDANCNPASSTVAYSACTGAGGGGITALTGSAVIQVANSAYISLNVLQNSGAALNVTNTGTYLSIAEL